MVQKSDTGLIKEKLDAVFKNYPQIAVAYLFGSHASGVSTPKSDFDIAVYFSEMDSVRRHEALFTLHGDIAAALESDAIDLHSINDIESPLLKYRIYCEGVLLFERGGYRIVLEPRMFNEYMDFLYLLRKHHLTTV